MSEKNETMFGYGNSIVRSAWCRLSQKCNARIRHISFRNRASYFAMYVEREQLRVAELNKTNDFCAKCGNQKMYHMEHGEYCMRCEGTASCGNTDYRGRVLCRTQNVGSGGA